MTDPAPVEVASIPTIPEIVIIMPAYNEQASVRKVVWEWFHEVENWTENFLFLALDDGSKDKTLFVLQ